MDGFTLMIVDDEKRIREGLATGFDWEALGFTVVGTAANGAEALSLAEEALPDVVITDIRMPVMDGLAFMEQMRERHPEARLVVLSGYDEFEYAKKAIGLGVVSYLLKPISEEELTALMGKLSRQLTEARTKASDADRSALSLLSPEEMADNQLRGLLYGDIPDPGMASRQLSMLAPRFSMKNLSVFVLSCPPELNVRKACKALSQGVGGRFLPDGSYIAGLMNRRPPKGDLTDPDAAALFAVLGTLLPRAAERIVVSCSRPFSGASGVSAAYREALELQRWGFYASPGELLQNGPSPSPVEPGNVPDTAQGLLAAMLAGSEVELRVLLKGFFDAQRAQFYPKELLSLNCSQLYETVARGLNLLSEEDRASLLARLMACSSFLTLRGLVESLFLGLLSRSRSSRSGSEQTLVQRIEAYVNENYEKKLTLSSLASMFHINASYLSYLFCQKAGVSLTAYIQDVRIKNAKRLLACADYRISEVANLVGYREYRHFCTVFKKEVGQTPMNYRLGCVIRPDRL